MQQHFSACSLRWLSVSIAIVIAVISDWSTVQSARERMHW